MKTLLVLLASFVLAFATTTEEREEKLQSVVDMQVSNTAMMEKRIAKIHALLEKKDQERIEKSKLREARLKKLDEKLQANALAREKASK